MDKEFVMDAINFKHVNVFTLVAEHCWYNRESDCRSLVTGSSVPSVLNLNCQRMFKKPLMIGRRGCIQRALNRKNG